MDFFGAKKAGTSLHVPTWLRRRGLKLPGVKLPNNKFSIEYAQPGEYSQTGVDQIASVPTAPSSTGLQFATLTGTGVVLWKRVAAISLIVLTTAGVITWVYRRRSFEPGLARSEQSNAIRPEAANAVGPESVDLGLDVTRKGSDFQVRWNRKSSRVLVARAGILRVLDRGRRIGREQVVRQMQIDLDSNQLRTGQIIHVPQSRDIEFTLILLGDDGATQEQVRVVKSSTTGMNETVRNGILNTGILSTGKPADRNNSQFNGESARSEPVTDERSRHKTFALPPEHPRYDVAPTLESHGPEILTGFEASTTTAYAARLSLILSQTHVTSSSDPGRQANGSSQSVTADRTASAGQRRDRVILPVLRQKTDVVIPPHMWSLLRRETIIEVKVIIDDSGRVQRVETQPLQGVNSKLTSLISDTVRQWVYDPALLDGKRVASEQVMQFTLKYRPN